MIPFAASQSLQVNSLFEQQVIEIKIAYQDGIGLVDRGAGGAVHQAPGERRRRPSKGRNGCDHQEDGHEQAQLPGYPIGRVPGRLFAASKIPKWRNVTVRLSTA